MKGQLEMPNVPLPLIKTCPHNKPLLGPLGTQSRSSLPMSVKHWKDTHETGTVVVCMGLSLRCSWQSSAIKTHNPEPATLQPSLIGEPVGIADGEYSQEEILA